MRTITFKSWDSIDEFNYCTGRLRLTVDGEEWVSGFDCLGHTFGCGIDEDGEEICEDGCWSLIDSCFEEFSEEEKAVILNLVNENIPAECCGGCL